MDTYMVTLANADGEDQRVLVTDKNPDRDWQEWVDTATFNPPLRIANPRVMGVHKLRVKHTPHNTVMPVAVG